MQTENDKPAAAAPAEAPAPAKAAAPGPGKKPIAVERIGDRPPGH